MGNEVDDIESRDVLHAEEIHGLRLFFTENGHEHVAARHLFLATRLHVEHGALQHALETERRLHVGLVIIPEQRRLLVDAFNQLAPQLRDVRVAGLENLVDLRNIEQGKQQVFDRHELMTAFAGPLKGLIQTKLELTAEHSL